GAVSPKGPPCPRGVCATWARSPMATSPRSAGDPERQLGWAAVVNETRALVPVDDVRDCSRDHDRDAELAELLDPPGVHANLFALGVDRAFHRSNSLTFLVS